MGKRRERDDNEPKVYSHIYYSKTSKNLMWYIFAPSSFTSHLSWTVSSYRQNSFINFWLRDITPSHITSLDVTPSELRTLEVLTFRHYTFRKLHLRAVSLSEYYTFGSYTFICFTYGILHPRKLHLQMFHLQDITISQNYTFQSFWRRPKVKSQRFNFPKVKSP